VDVYLTIDRQNCNSTCSNGILQYPDGNNICQYCGVYCYTCQTVSTQCLSCIASQNRILNGSLCICNPLGFYDDTIDYVCPACHYSCTSCTFSNNATCTACNLTVNYRLLNNDSCPCITGYYDAGMAICGSCHYSCWNCTGAGNSACLVCNASWLRYLSGNSCLCNLLYYDSGTNICQPCYYTCLTCSSNTFSTCTSCNSTANRYLSINSCSCIVSYYDIGSNIMQCSACDPTCLVCNGPLNTNCITLCDITKFRYLVGSQCICVAHYYDLNSVCYPCDVTCGNCTGSTNI
jgi:proprotein convertase subtilisin/kexin type 5